MHQAVLIGSSGQLGRALRSQCPSHVRLDAWSRAEADLANVPALLARLDSLKPALVLNAAAYTAVDRAETDPESARAINALAPGALAQWCVEHDATFVHYSTDYVFDGSGDQPRVETDPTGPLNVYGRTKLEGERLTLESGARALVFRTSWVYAAEGANFLRTMLRLGAEREALSIVDDQFGAPTLADDLAAATWHALGCALNPDGSSARPEVSGLYHVCGGGVTTWKRFAEAIFEGARERGTDLRVKTVRAVTTAEYGAPAARPLNSRLSCARFRQTFDFTMPSWENALQRTLTGTLEGMRAGHSV